MSDLRRYRERSSGLVFRVERQARSPDGPIGLEAMLNPNVKREVRGESIARDFDRFDLSSVYAPTCEKCGGEKIRVGGAPGLYCMHCHVPKTPPGLSPLKPGVLAFGAEGEGALSITREHALLHTPPRSIDEIKSDLDAARTRVINLSAELDAHRVKCTTCRCMVLPGRACLCCAADPPDLDEYACGFGGAE